MRRAWEHLPTPQKRTFLAPIPPPHEKCASRPVLTISSLKWQKQIFACFRAFFHFPLKFSLVPLKLPPPPKKKKP